MVEKPAQFLKNYFVVTSEKTDGLTKSKIELKEDYK
jgi:hypothetical protein